MNKNFTKFLNQVAEDKGCTMVELLEEDGKVILDDNYDNKYKGVIELHNCINNPLYFLDKCKVPVIGCTNRPSLEPMNINITTFMALKTLNPPQGRASSNVIVNAPINTHNENFFLGYALYKLLFTKGYCIINSSSYNEAERYLNDLYDMYEQLPKYLKVRSIEYIQEYVLIQVLPKQYKELQDKKSDINLILYMNPKLTHPNDYIIDDEVQTIVQCTGGDSRTIMNRIKVDALAMRRHNFKIVQFSAKEMGFNNMWIASQIEMLSKDPEKIAQELYMEYDELTEQDIEKLNK